MSPSAGMMAAGGSVGGPPSSGLGGISGLMAAYSASAPGASYTDGQSMPTWNDLTINAHHLVASHFSNRPQFAATAGPSGGPAVRFPAAAADQDFSAPASLFNALNAANQGHIYVGIKSNLGAGNLHGWALFGGNSNSHYGADANWQIAENWGSSARYSVARPQDGGGTTLPLNVWRTYDVVSTPSNYKIRIDDISQTVAYVDGTLPNDPVFHRVFLGDAYARLGSGYQPLNGWMTWCYIFDHELTAGENTTLRGIIATYPSGVLAL